MASPYSKLGPTSFWRTGIAGAAAGEFPGLMQPRFDITKDMAIATAGSCFAQHVGRTLRRIGYNVIDAEPPPAGLTEEQAKSFGFSLYSARHGNIYSFRQMLQLAMEAFGRFKPGDVVWQRDGRYFDALRPTVEPDGLHSAELVLRHRTQHLAQVRRVLREADLLVFTLGLVEAWVHAPTGTVYPTAPGVVADSEAPDEIVLKSFSFMEIRSDILLFRRLMQKYNPRLRILFTVSPVPLTATATDDHVLVATMHAKSTLRAVVGAIRAECPEVDYFPSYEIIAGHPSAGRYYAPNLREVLPAGVDCVMRHFTAAYGAEASPAATPAEPLQVPRTTLAELQNDDEAVVCEEMLLEAFAPAAKGG